MTTLVGKIVCRRINRGPKKKYGFFILADNDARETKIKLKKNHHQRALKAFVGKWVLAKGVYNRGIFIAKSAKIY